jgi:hypothetical protein
MAPGNHPIQSLPDPSARPEPRPAGRALNWRADDLEQLDEPANDRDLTGVCLPDVYLWPNVSKICQKLLLSQALAGSFPAMALEPGKG